MNFWRAFLHCESLNLRMLEIHSGEDLSVIMDVVDWLGVWTSCHLSPNGLELFHLATGESCGYFDKNGPCQVYYPFGISPSSCEASARVICVSKEKFNQNDCPMDGVKETPYRYSKTIHSCKEEGEEL